MCEKLKPCHCGGETQVQEVMGSAYYVNCKECLHPGLYLTPEKAVEAHNKSRALEQELVEALKELRAKIRDQGFPEEGFMIATCNELIAKAEGKSPNNQTDGVA